MSKSEGYKLILQTLTKHLIIDIENHDELRETVADMINQVERPDVIGFSVMSNTNMMEPEDLHKMITELDDATHELKERYEKEVLGKGPVDLST